VIARSKVKTKMRCVGERGGIDGIVKLFEAG
jgi:hypothetical protein